MQDTFVSIRLSPTNGTVLELRCTALRVSCHLYFVCFTKHLKIRPECEINPLFTRTLRSLGFVLPHPLEEIP